MKNYLVALLFCLISSLAFAQNFYQDVVYLKDGSIIRGIIIEQVPNKSIKIETENRNIFVYQIDDVERLVKEKMSDHNDSKIKVINKNGLQKGYKAIIDLGFQLSRYSYYEDDLESGIRFDFVNGHQFNPYFYLGAGIGLRHLISFETAIIPLFVNLKTNFIDHKNSPFLSVKIGHSFVNDEISLRNYGFLLSPSVGGNFKISPNSFLNVGLGYEMQGSTYSIYKYIHSMYLFVGLTL